MYHVTPCVATTNIFLGIAFPLTEQVSDNDDSDDTSHNAPTFPEGRMDDIVITNSSEKSSDAYSDLDSESDEEELWVKCVTRSDVQRSG